MMIPIRHKYILLVLSFALLVIMLCGSRQAGVSCDEVLHYNQSVSVYNYFVSHGKDRSCLDTPGSQLKYYGQSYDNITTFLIKLFGIEDIYGLRHIMATLAGWLTIIIAVFFAVRLSGYEAGITVILLFAISSTFLGHSQNNLKDIPFALGYISVVFFMIRFILSEKKIPIADSVLLALSIAFCMSIRASGMILICYLLFFFFTDELIKYFNRKGSNINVLAGKFFLIIIISATGWLLSVILWPYGLQNPVVNPVKAHLLMSRFPLSFREVFEGRLEWTDYMPWYYLPKYMLITIPVTVTAGLLLFIFFSPKIFRKGNSLAYFILVFSIIFPLVYTVFSKPNIYSGWRQFMFLYPGIVILSAVGISTIFKLNIKNYIKWFCVALLFAPSFHAVKFLTTNYRYAYLYFNQLVGGVKGANGNYEIDYYFIGQREASEWLTEYLERKGIKDSIIVASNFSAEWYFRNQPLIKNIYIRNEERSTFEWDYYISTNRYIMPFRLKEGLWPPSGALKVVYAGEAPVCTVIERKSKADYMAFRALQENRPGDAVKLFSKALSEDSYDEMIFYNFAIVLNRERDSVKADSVLNECLRVNPFFEPALMYAGIISISKGEYDKAEGYFEKLIDFNRKYFEAYVKLAEVTGRKDTERARKILRQCLEINPAYKPALMALADSYRSSNPDIARKYDEIVNRIK